MRSSFRSIEVRILALTIAPLLIAAAPAPTLPRKLPPIHQCNDDRSFDSFGYTLAQAVARRDRGSLLELFAPDVLLNFGGSRGRDELVKEWEFDAAEYANIWRQLEIMLKMGCAKSNGARVIPSLSVQVEPYAEEQLRDRILILPGARLLKERGVEHPNPDTIGWSVARVISRVADWGTGVRLPDGREGYIFDDEVYEPAGYRMLIEKRDGKWMITAFVAGD